jgi:long-chain acyl-CoA synthetase
MHPTLEATQPIAIIVPHEVNLHTVLSDDQDVTTAPLADLCTKTKVRALILQECNAVRKKSGFKNIEMLQAVVLTPDEWTPESGLVTAVQKIQWRKIAQTFDTEIKVRFYFFLGGGAAAAAEHYWDSKSGHERECGMRE